MSAALSVFEHRADRESLPSWTWITGDAWPHGTPIVLTVRGRPADWQGDPPARVAALFDALAERIAGGLHPRAGTVVELGPDGGYPAAVVLSPAVPIPGVPVPEHALALVGLHASELAALEHVGKTRILSHLARLENATAFPRGCDWRRAPVADRLGVNLTKLAATRRVAVPDWCVVSRGAGLTIRVLEGSDNGLADIEGLAAGTTIGFLTDPAWDTPPGHPWPPPPQDNDRPEVLGAWSTPDAPAGGAQGFSPAFLAVTTAEEDGVSNMEDGLLLKLKPATQKQLADALKRHQRLDLEFPDRTVFRVRWASRTAAPLKIADKDLPCPERPPVPPPAPTFAKQASWQTFTTPFVKVQAPQAKKA